MTINCPTIKSRVLEKAIREMKIEEFNWEANSDNELYLVLESYIEDQLDRCSSVSYDEPQYEAILASLTTEALSSLRG